MKSERFCDCRDCLRSERLNQIFVYGIVVPFLACMVIFVIVTIRSAVAYAGHPEPAQPEIWYGPEIPKCDQPLWERIKDRCSDEGQRRNDSN